MNTRRKTFTIITIAFLVGILFIGTRAVWRESPERAPSRSEQTTAGVDPQTLVTAYVTEHLSELSPTKAVLGGTFFPTLIYVPSEGVAIVEYEDGHIALTARATYTTEGAEVRVISFTEFEDSFRRDGNLIKDNPGLPPGVWHLSFDSPGKAGNITPLAFSQATRCTEGDGAVCKVDSLSQGMRVRILGTEGNGGVAVRRIEVLTE